MVKEHRAGSGSVALDLGDGWGENELWRYTGFGYDPRSALIMSDLWQDIFPLCFSFLIYNVETIRPPPPWGCNEDGMKSRENSYIAGNS